MKLTTYKSAGIGEQARLKAEVTKTGYTVFALNPETGEWEPAEQSRGFKSQAAALEAAKQALNAWTLN